MDKKEIIEKINKCKNKDEVISLFNNHKDELNDDELDLVSGGCGESDSGDTPKYNIGEIVGINYGLTYAIYVIDSVSLSKTMIDGYNQFTYSLTNLQYKSYKDNTVYRTTSKKENIPENWLEKCKQVTIVDN